MSSAAWKDLERRVCADFGGRRAGPLGAAVSDCVGVPYSIETKRITSRTGPAIYARWIVQAREQSQRERLPWILVVADHNDRQPIAALDYRELRRLARLAAVIPTPAVAPPIPGQLEIE